MRLLLPDSGHELLQILVEKVHAKGERPRRDHTLNSFLLLHLIESLKLLEGIVGLGRSDSEFVQSIHVEF